jgi:hypothetical protein
MKFTALATLVAILPPLVSSAGTSNPFNLATPFLIPEYVEEVKTAVARLVTVVRLLLSLIYSMHAVCRTSLSHLMRHKLRTYPYSSGWMWRPRPTHLELIWLPQILLVQINWSRPSYTTCPTGIVLLRHRRESSLLLTEVSPQ